MPRAGMSTSSLRCKALDPIRAGRTALLRGIFAAPHRQRNETTRTCRAKSGDNWLRHGLLRPVFRDHPEPRPSRDGVAHVPRHTIAAAAGGAFVFSVNWPHHGSMKLSAPKSSDQTDPTSRLHLQLNFSLHCSPPPSLRLRTD